MLSVIMLNVVAPKLVVNFSQDSELHSYKNETSNGARTLRITVFSITPHSITKLNVTTRSVATLSITAHRITIQTHHTQHRQRSA